MTERLRRILPSLLVLLALSAAAAVVLWPVMNGLYWWRSHDGQRYPYLLYMFRLAVLDGIAYPRWLPQMNGGYGYPTFLFYQPGFFYFSLPFTFLFESNILNALHAATGAMLLAGGIGAYRLGRYFANPRGFALFFATVFLFSPYLLFNFYRRADYAELFAMLPLPWLFLFLFQLRDRLARGASIRGSAAGLALVLTAVIYLHPFVALFCYPVIAGFFLVAARRAPNRGEILLTGAAILLLAAVLSASYWLPVVQLKEQVRYQAAITGRFGIFAHFRGIAETLLPDPASPRFWYLLAALCGFALAWRDRAMRYLLGVLIASLVLITPLSRPFWYLFAPLTQYVQFPWRLYALISTLLLIGMLQLAPLLTFLHRKRPAYAALTLIAAALLMLPLRLPFKNPDGDMQHRLALRLDSRGVQSSLSLYPYFPRMREKEATEFFTGAAANEFMPKTARLSGLPMRLGPAKPFAEFLEPDQVPASASLAEEKTQGKVRYHDPVMKASLPVPATLLLNQFYFPGWRLTVNGEPVTISTEGGPALQEKPTAGLDLNGRMLLRLPAAGEWRVQAAYEGPPHWRERNTAMLILTLALLGVLQKRVAICRFFSRNKPL